MEVWKKFNEKEVSHSMAKGDLLMLLHRAHGHGCVCLDVGAAGSGGLLLT